MNETERISCKHKSQKSWAKTNFKRFISPVLKLNIRILQLSILNFQEENTATSSAFPNIKSQTLFPKN